MHDPFFILITGCSTTIGTLIDSFADFNSVLITLKKKSFEKNPLDKN